MVGFGCGRVEEILEETVGLVGRSLLEQVIDFWRGLGQEGEDLCLKKGEVEFVERLNGKGHNSASRHFEINNKQPLLSDFLGPSIPIFINYE